MGLEHEQGLIYISPSGGDAVDQAISELASEICRRPVSIYRPTVSPLLSTAEHLC